MTYPLQPLINAAEQKKHQAAKLQLQISQSRQLLANNPLHGCPICGSANDVALHDCDPLASNPNAHSLCIKCTNCSIQTVPAYWFITHPTSALEAIQTVIDRWNNRDSFAMRQEITRVKEQDANWVK